MTRIWVAGKDGSPDLIAHVQDLVLECHKLATEAAEARTKSKELVDALLECASYFDAYDLVNCKAAQMTAEVLRSCGLSDREGK